MALSLRMGSLTLYMYLQLALLALLAPALSLFTYRVTKNKVAAACALLLGMTVAYELVARTAAYLPEGFGAPIVIFALLLFLYPNRWFLCRTIGAGILLGIAAMVKEPFVASFVLGALLFCRSKRDILQLALCLGVGGAVALLLLAVSGNIEGYFLLYLPEMFSGRTMNSVQFPSINLGVYYIIPAPLLLRTLNAFSLFTMMAVPLQSVLFSLFFFTCIAIYAPLRTEFNKKTIFLSAILIFTVLFVAHIGYSLYGLIAALQLSTETVHLEDLGSMRTLILAITPILMGAAQLLALLVLPIGIALLVLFGQYMKKNESSYRTLFFVCATLAGFFSTAALVAFGGDYIGQYLGFAFPPLISLAIYCLREGVERKLFLIVSALSCLLIVHAFIPGKTNAHLLPYDSWEEVEPEVKKAEAIDDLLDACGVERYFLARSVQYYYAFTRHSPYQIFWGHRRSLGPAWSDVSERQTPNSYLAEKFMSDLQEAKIILMEPVDDPSVTQVKASSGKLYPDSTQTETAKSRLPEPIISTLLSEFSLSPPRCAVGKVPIDGVKIFFRRMEW